MSPSEKNGRFPVFEPNQVLSAGNLNQIFNYLDEQERLTRANLVGIGIVCGLEVSIDAARGSIHLSKGCGISSEGYLIVEPADDLELTSFRKYELPSSEHGYPVFEPAPNTWELFPAGEPDTTPLKADDLKDKVLLLFLELKKEAMLNCGPDCDDRGTQVTATARRLLIGRSDLDKNIESAAAIHSGLSSAEVAESIKARLGLKDIRLPRYDVPNTNPITSEKVLAAFLAVFQGLAKDTAGALAAAYKAFRPLLKDLYPDDPFTAFADKYGFLDRAPETREQTLFLQYYVDLFDDLLKAYDEFRWKGTELLCACCPPGELFPRHLMLGLVIPETGDDAAIYRQQFMASPAVARCGKLLNETRRLFRRLVEMTVSFTEGEKSAEEIRITPDRSGDVPLSKKAIPYYYNQKGTPPLYQLWDNEKTTRDRANQNLSYRSDEFVPTAPPFVTDPLRYDLEPFNFFRVEGHLGWHYSAALEYLQSLKDKYRLPIDIIALSTGAFIERGDVDLSKGRCQFRDLEAIYDALRQYLLGSLCEGVMYLYDIPIARAESDSAGKTPRLPLLKKYAPDYRFKDGTVAAWYESILDNIQSIPYVDLGEDIPIIWKRLSGFFDFLISRGLSAEHSAAGASIYYLSKFAEVLPDSLASLSPADVENRYRDLKAVVFSFREKEDTAERDAENLSKFIPREDLIDHLDQVLSSCRLEPFRAIHKEYVRRIREDNQKQFLSYYCKKHPGIQHRAGVPVGGTFIIVYHESPAPIRAARGATAKRAAGYIEAAEPITNEIKRVLSKAKLLADPDVRRILTELTGRVVEPPTGAGGLDKEAEKVLTRFIKGFEPGIVIADFFLPYICCSDLPLTPEEPLPLSFSVKIGCTSPGPDGVANVTLTPRGGIGPYKYRLGDGQPFVELKGALQLNVGSYKLVVQDSAGAESAVQSIEVPKPLAIGEETYVNNIADGTYQVKFDISGGTYPYQALDRVRPPITGGTVDRATFTSKPVKLNQIEVKIVDAAGCQIGKRFYHNLHCKLPCDGIAVRRGYRFTLPSRGARMNYISFTFEYPKNRIVDLSDGLAKLIRTYNGQEDFAKRLNKLIAETTGNADCFIINYRPSLEPQFGVDTWEIEYLNCLEFRFNAVWAVGSTGDTHNIPSAIEIACPGTRVKMSGGLLPIPAYDIARIDKCVSDHPSEELCKETDLKVEIIKKIGDKHVMLGVKKISGADVPVAYLWEVQDGTQTMMSVSERGEFVFNSTGNKAIRLSVYTKSQCRLVVTDTVTIGGS